LNVYFRVDDRLIKAIGCEPSFDLGGGLTIVTPTESILFRVESGGLFKGRRNSGAVDAS
jgi:hypothetical protein